MQAGKPKLLITGINGRIGSVISSPLAASYDVFGLDVEAPYTCQVMQGDISDYEQVVGKLRQLEKLPYMIHLAADQSQGVAWESVLKNNIVGTRNVFESARQIGVKRIIYASTNHVTGAYEGFPPHRHLHLERNPEKIRVNQAIRPDGEYAVSKVFGEALARYYYERWGIEFVCLRIGTVLANDDPTVNPRLMKTWLSHRDLIHLVERSLIADVPFGIYYGISDNKDTFWDISNARKELGYMPVDDASRLVSQPPYYRRLLGLLRR